MVSKKAIPEIRKIAINRPKKTRGAYNAPLMYRSCRHRFIWLRSNKYLGVTLTPCTGVSRTNMSDISNKHKVFIAHNLFRKATKHYKAMA